MKLFFKTPISKPFEKVRDGFTRDLFVYLSPSFIPSELIRFDGCKKNDEVHIKLGPGPISQKWISLITFEETNAAGWSFIDEGKVLPWPLRYWKHHHRVDKISSNECCIVDDIEYACTNKLLDTLVKPFLWSVFAIRPKRYQTYFKG